MLINEVQQVIVESARAHMVNSFKKQGVTHKDFVSGRESLGIDVNNEPIWTESFDDAKAKSNFNIYSCLLYTSPSPRD